MQRSLTLFFLGLCAPLLSAQPFTQFEDLSGRFVLDLPAGWKYLPRADEHRVTFEGPAKQQLMVVHVPDAAAAADAFARGLEAAPNLASQKPKAVEFTVNGERRLWAEYDDGSFLGGAAGFYVHGRADQDRPQWKIAFVSLRQSAASPSPATAEKAIDASAAAALGRQTGGERFEHGFATLTLPAGWKRAAIPPDQPGEAFGWFTFGDKLSVGLLCYKRGRWVLFGSTWGDLPTWYLGGVASKAKKEKEIPTAGGEVAFSGHLEGDISYEGSSVKGRVLTAAVEYKPCGLRLLGDPLPLAEAQELAPEFERLVAALGPGIAKLRDESGLTAGAKVIQRLPEASKARLEAAAKTSAREWWRIPTEAGAIEFMELIGPDKLLVGLQDQARNFVTGDLILIDRKSGREFWRVDRKKGYLGIRFQPVRLQEDVFLFRAELDNGASFLVALEPGTGKEIWRTKPGGIWTPLSGERVPFVAWESRVKDDANLQVYTLPSGGSLWQRKIRVQTWKGREKDRLVGLVKQRGLPKATLAAQDILHFYEGPERVAGNSGESRWKRRDLLLEEGAPEPVVESGHVYVVHSGTVLGALDVETGASKWNTPLPAGCYINLIKTPERLYAFGFALNSAGSPDRQDWLLTVADARDGRILWTFRSQEKLAGGLAETGKRVYYATASAVVSLDAETGRQLFRTEVREDDSLDNPRIRVFQRCVAYLSDDAVAGVHPETGALLYVHATNRLSREMDLGTLLGIIPGFHRRTKRNARDTAVASGLAAMEKTAAGAGFDPTFTPGLGVAMLGAVNAFEAGYLRAHQEMLADRIRLLRASSQGQDTGDYAFRVNRRSLAADDDFVLLNSIHLPSGRRRDMILTPNYMGYGASVLVDPVTLEVYFSGIGLDPSRFEFRQEVGHAASSSLTQASLRLLRPSIMAKKIVLP